MYQRPCRKKGRYQAREHREEELKKHDIVEGPVENKCDTQEENAKDESSTSSDSK